MTEKGKEKIERFVRDTEKKAESLYNRGYTDGKNDSYALGKESGMNKLWEALKEIKAMPHRDYELFIGGIVYWSELFDKLTPQELIAKFEEYKAQDSDIQIGDYVRDPNGIECIVTNTDTSYHLYYPHNGKTWKAPKSTELTKTGVHGRIIATEGDLWTNL